MSDSEIEPGGGLLPEPNTYNPIFGVSMPPGTPVSFAVSVANTAQPAKADSADTAYAFGIVIRNAAPGDRGGVRYQGPVTLEEWGDVLDTGTQLDHGAPYYVSATHAGVLTKTKPNAEGQFVAPVGYGVGPQTLFVQPSFAGAAL